MPKLFGVTLFVSATLLFLVQPMVGKMILPLLGGTPAVWNTCMVFFQALLLARLLLRPQESTTAADAPAGRRSHRGPARRGRGRSPSGRPWSTNHSPVPIVKSLAPQGSDMPFFGVLLLLAVAIGLPFFTVSTTAPLLQKWFSETGHPSAKDPYFLYAASNFGSLLGTGRVPVRGRAEPAAGRTGVGVGRGFVVMVVLILAVRAGGQVRPRRRPVDRRRRRQRRVADEPPPHWATQVRWLLLAAVPSSLMLAVTTDVTTDMVSMPLCGSFRSHCT